MIELLSNLDPRSIIEVAGLLIVLYVLFHRHQGSGPMSPEWRTFLIKFIENNTGICWAFLVMMIFLVGLVHSSHEKLDATISETLKSILLVASGWLGNMLQGRSPARSADKQELQPGVQGTQETETVVTTKTKQEVPAVPVIPAEPIVVTAVDPLPVKIEEGKPEAV